MTEVEWLACDNPRKRLASLGPQASDRKLRLFSVACMRRVWHLFEDPRLQRARRDIEVAELYCDGRADETALRVTEPGDHIMPDQVVAVALSACQALPALRKVRHTIAEAEEISRAVANSVAYTYWLDANLAQLLSTMILPATLIPHRLAERVAHNALVADIFNPFRRGQLQSHWLTATAASIAEAIYDDRAFDRLPILADALEDAGCTDQDILDHCRGGGEHVRGCWVVDLVLGKE